MSARVAAPPTTTTTTATAKTPTASAAPSTATTYYCYYCYDCYDYDDDYYYHHQGNPPPPKSCPRRLLGTLWLWILRCTRGFGQEDRRGTEHLQYATPENRLLLLLLLLLLSTTATFCGHCYCQPLPPPLPLLLLRRRLRQRQRHDVQHRTDGNPLPPNPHRNSCRQIVGIVTCGEGLASIVQVRVRSR